MSDTATKIKTGAILKNGKSDMFFDMVKWVIEARSDDPTRYFMNGFNMETEDGLRIMVATDGRRLHYIRFIDPDPRLPEDGNWTVKAVNKDTITYVTCEGNYPNWRKVTPSKFAEEGNLEKFAPVTYGNLAKDGQVLGRRYAFDVLRTGSIFNIDYYKALGNEEWVLVRERNDEISRYYYDGNSEKDENGQEFKKSTGKAHEWINVGATMYDRHCIIMPQNRS